MLYLPVLGLPLFCNFLALSSHGSSYSSGGRLSSSFTIEDGEDLGDACAAGDAEALGEEDADDCKIPTG